MFVWLLCAFCFCLFCSVDFAFVGVQFFVSLGAISFILFCFCIVDLVLYLFACVVCCVFVRCRVVDRVLHFCLYLQCKSCIVLLELCVFFCFVCCVLLILFCVCYKVVVSAACLVLLLTCCFVYVCVLFVLLC